jgi:DNA-binding MarR family transcriptional regulator
VRADATDGRAKRVVLTEDGRRFRDEAIAAMEAGMAGIADQLDDGSLPDTVARLRRVRRVLDAAR